MNPEVFYLHIGGEQKGPYTIPQIDHLLNSGLIGEETLYWREGMEQWSPVTDVVGERRRPVRKWKRRAVALALLLLVLFFARLFGPIALVGWRETAQYDFTPKAAYWRARDVVRHQALPAAADISFSSLENSQVQTVDAPPGAIVTLHTEVPQGGGEPQSAAWRVTLTYNSQLKEWTGRAVQQVPL